MYPWLTGPPLIEPSPRPARAGRARCSSAAPLSRAATVSQAATGAWTPPILRGPPCSRVRVRY